MSDVKTPPDLSIDEILATIRRIIADDEQATAGSAGTASPATASPATASPATAPTATAAPIAARPDADGERAAAAPSADGPDAEAEAEADDVLELTEALNEDGTIRHLAPIGGGRRRLPGAGDAAAAALRAEPELRPRPAPEVRPAVGAPNLRPSTPAGATAAGERESRLPRDLPRDLPLGGGERTLEDLVRDTLRPLLQAWIDENLPPLVERLVQAEIARVAREAGAA